MEREVRRQVSEVGVVVGLAQQGKGKGNQVRGVLLAESTQRLLWMSHQCLPSVVAEARFDVGKLLLNYSVRSIDEKVEMEKEDGMEVEGEEVKDEDEEPGQPLCGLVKQVQHLTQISTSSSNPSLPSQPPSSATHFPPSYSTSSHKASFSNLTLPNLPSGFLAYHTCRSPGAESTDGTPLKDEGEVVIRFLDECVQWCLKTPCCYIEDMYALFTATPGEIPDRLDTCPSPLSPSQVRLLASQISKFHAPAIRDLVEHLDPEQSKIWDGLESRGCIGFSGPFGPHMAFLTRERR
ncbi:uncharacterized protein LACBIDRAFT_315004 [Laccaria bicolor S238N-H82]|uniref:Predicted protein n=1 Tax=Laccaria bicolor (strain S238N-H82 / ATCC MYA-4686) TaxID=486041 RepID=B0DZJ3_LACBS|nr:uncharacterized protein LACBIDRAFT_315004 [Laccaria bicolor S238N-H82]EDQ99984.1 predicted protein [Laccaria bicolor S238N-H82]|eukprot:XP_001889395.1 predicted protein [Laccaria bicolor S238N-H82]